MCGIFGHLNPRGADLGLVERMASTLAHRGPDGYGTHSFGPLAFGAGRLAIIDLSAPAGPIFNEDRRAAVVFNGEIYNYRELRAELERTGHHFATRTDTEVLIHGYEQWGDGVLERLRGMFALGIWDSSRERLLLARDRLGEKPLVVADLGNGEFVFASEIKALFQHPGLRRVVDADLLPAYFALGYAPAPRTLFTGVQKLRPAEWLAIERGQITRGLYWQPAIDTTFTSRRPVSYDEAVRQTRALLTEAVEMRLMSDVPIGAFLSGGVDSTAVVALMSRALNRPVETFTVGFDMGADERANAKFNVDARYAALAAERLGTHHHSITLKTDSQLSALLPHLVHSMDEPIAEQAIFQTPYIAALARQNGVPVLLTGDGGDELFMGYNHFRQDLILERYLRLPALLRQSILTPLLERAPARWDSVRKLAQKSRTAHDPVVRYLEWKRMADTGTAANLLHDPAQVERGTALLRASLLPLLEHPHSPNFSDRLAYAGLGTWLAENSNMRVDKMTMAMSTEARAPFEDHHLTAFALNLPRAYKLRRGDFKTVLKDAVADLVPAEILNRPKWGFQPPISEWLRTSLRPLVETVLAPERVAAAGFFRPEAVQSIVQAHLSRQSYKVWTVFPLLVFHLWHALYITQDWPLSHDFTPERLGTDLPIR